MNRTKSVNFKLRSREEIDVAILEALRSGSGTRSYCCYKVEICIKTIDQHIAELILKGYVKDRGRLKGANRFAPTEAGLEWLQQYRTLSTSKLYSEEFLMSAPPSTLGGKQIDSDRMSFLLKLETDVKTLFMTHPELSTSEVVKMLETKNINPRDLYDVLNRLSNRKLIQRSPISGGKWISLMPQTVKTSVSQFLNDPRVPKNIQFLDWNGVMPQLIKCYELKIFPMLIGPKGGGKTTAVQRLCELEGTPLDTINLSLRTREHHFLGRLDPRPDGSVNFKKGVLVKSMEEGTTLLIDELSAGEGDTLLRIDEATDDRRQVTLEDETIKARDSWFCIASINPLSHAGTKELPPQILSRFPVRIYFNYPDVDNEMEIVRMHAPKLHDLMTMKNIVEAIQQLRTQDLPYTPSIRETVTIGKLLESGASVSKAVEWCLINIYYQYDASVADKVRELLISRGVKIANKS